MNAAKYAREQGWEVGDEVRWTPTGETAHVAYIGADWGHVIIAQEPGDGSWAFRHVEPRDWTKVEPVPDWSTGRKHNERRRI